MPKKRKGAKSMTPQTSDKYYIIAFGSSQTFYVTQEEAKAIVGAKEQGKQIVKFRNRVFSTNFFWLLPENELEPHALSRISGKKPLPRLGEVSDPLVLKAVNDTKERGKS